MVLLPRLQCRSDACGSYFKLLGVDTKRQRELVAFGAQSERAPGDGKNVQFAAALFHLRVDA